MGRPGVLAGRLLNNTFSRLAPRPPVRALFRVMATWMSGMRPAQPGGSSKRQGGAERGEEEGWAEGSVGVIGRAIR